MFTLSLFYIVNHLKSDQELVLNTISYYYFCTTIISFHLERNSNIPSFQILWSVSFPLEWTPSKFLWESIDPNKSLFFFQLLFFVYEYKSKKYLVDWVCKIWAQTKIYTRRNIKTNISIFYISHCTSFLNSNFAYTWMIMYSIYLYLLQIIFRQRLLTL